MFPACFSSTHSEKTQLPQSLITSTYQTQLSLCNNSISSSTYLITLTWSKSLFSHTLTIHATDLFTITISLYPSTFSLFKTRSGSGSKSITLTHHKLKLYYDFTKAKFSPNSAEPSSAFYVAIACNEKFQFFIGDLQHELSKRSGMDITCMLNEQAMLLSRREHVFNKNVYLSSMHVMGTMHEVNVACNEEKDVLRVKVDGEIRLVVNRLAWKFRGNEKIYVNGIEVEFFWDVFNWVNGGNGGCGVFVFQVGEGNFWPEMVGPEKRLMKSNLSFGGSVSTSAMSFWPSPSCSSVLQWAEESSDCGRSSCSSSTRSCGSNGGFSLMVYAWRKD